MSRLVAALLSLFLVAPPAAGATWPDALTGRLATIVGTESVRIGYRDDATPFSFTAGFARPRGYSIDLCEAIVASLAQEYGRPLSIRYVRVTPEDRLDKVASGAVDLECGATTDTAVRRQQVAFSATIFVSTVRLAVPASSPVRSLAALQGRSVAVVRGTTTEAAIREVIRLRKLDVQVTPVGGYPAALDEVRSGRSLAVAADDVLVAGTLALQRRGSEFRLVGQPLSVERYALVLPRDDPAFAQAVEMALRGLAESREVLAIYDRWFMRPLPSGIRMQMPMSVPLRRSLELIGLPTE